MSELVRVTHNEAGDFLTGAGPMQFPFLDEFVARGVDVHFEAMSNNSFWIGIDFEDGTHWAINCGAVNDRAKGYAFAEEEA